MEILRTTHLKCPECGGHVMEITRAARVKGHMTIYGKDGVRHGSHMESRCQDCRHVKIKLDINNFEYFQRIGLFYGYRVLKGGKKVFEQDALRNRSLGWKLYFSFEYGQALPLPPIANFLQIRHQHAIYVEQQI